MSSPRTQITVSELNDEIVPRLDLVEKLINTTLASLIETTDSDEERARREDQKRRFELMLLSIRMNVASVSRRHATVIRAIQNGDRSDGSLLQLDENEAIALDNARLLYAQVKENTRQ
ncbi:hypothetical protein C8E00_103164 [Chromohalobacter marismortui]|uniref:Uncharacterized protein n=1 Tax=Chromohalobacter marismortui TaxID=42055 RepID=A0A4R7NQ93_9GAMM|nr:MULTISPECIES: hypothetical protein [Chromohalobacter]MCI0508825.1 hypothetical protein [Chromohalobacter sp.]MCI0594318.1 hypothetical protein [Chromohalobacter sp.]TDU22802.1 hypothetical protein C8E00_103164 [Chromohalobacter marismortui]